VNPVGSEHAAAVSATEYRDIWRTVAVDRFRGILRNDRPGPNSGEVRRTATSYPTTPRYRDRAAFAFTPQRSLSRVGRSHFLFASGMRARGTDARLFRCTVDRRPVRFVGVWLADRRDSSAVCYTARALHPPTPPPPPLPAPTVKRDAVTTTDSRRGS
jgi:hypothetical protein